MQNVGTFQMRLKGFRDPPVDHYGRPLYLFAESRHTSKPLCFGSVTRLQSMFDWMRDFFDMYSSQPKFSFLFHSHYSHNSNNRLPYADDELLQFLQTMNERGYLDNTMLIVMADHGARSSSLRKTYQGKLEERLPFMSIRLPPKFQKQYPELLHNLRLNSHRLTTPFDVHETFQHLFDFHSVNSYQSKSNRSYSLFQLVPETRTCAQADVEQHWCACLNWQDISVNEIIIQQLGKATIQFLNKFMSDVRDECAPLTLFHLNKASQLQANDRLLKFVDSIGRDGRIPRFNNASVQSDTNQTRYYQIQFETVPGHGQFELTAEYYPAKDVFDIRKQRLSRINKYGEASACIAYKRPEFRELCYCSNLLQTTT